MLKIAHRRPHAKTHNKIKGSKYMKKSAHRPKKGRGRKKSWRQFQKERMGPYMKKYGGHGPAMKQISKEWKAYKAKTG